MKRIEPYIITILSFLLLLSVVQCQDNNQKASGVKTMYEASLDSLTTFKNQKGELVSRIATITSSNTKLFSELKSKDSTITELQGLVKEYKKELKDGGSAGIIYIEGKKEIITKTTVDTITGDYSSDFSLNGWIWGKVFMNKDTTILNINTKEKVSFVIGKEKTGFLGLGKPKYFSDVKLENPYNTVTGYRTYNVSIPENKWIVSIGASGIYDFNSGSIIIGPSINIGYKVLSW